MTAGLPVATFSARRFVRGSFLVSATLVLALAGCGGDEEAAAPAAANPPTNPPPGGTNRNPTIAGTPLTSVLVGTAYAFSPSASDADNDVLTFRITGRPAWATFNAATGQLSGTPSGAQVGSYSNIVISVTDGAADATLAAFSINVVATATGSATLSWNPPTQNTDGSAPANLAGYRIYWGTAQGNLANSVTVNNPGLSSYVVDQLTPATWYFATTAVNSQGAESAFSNLAFKVVL